MSDATPSTKGGSLGTINTTMRTPVGKKTFWLCPTGIVKIGYT